MTPTARTGPDEQEADRPASPRGGPALAVIAAAQLMLVLNGSLLTTELPGFLASLDPRVGDRMVREGLCADVRRAAAARGPCG